MSNRFKITFLMILTLILINCSSVFASSVTIENIEEIIERYNSSWTLNENQITKFEECLSSYSYMSFTKDTKVNNLNFIFYNNTPTINTRNVATFIDCRRLQLNTSNQTAIWDNTYSSINYNFYDTYDWYTESGFYEEGTTKYKVEFEPGATNMDIIFEEKTPWFEYSQGLITNYVTVENEYVNRKFNAFSLQYIASNNALGSLYTDLSKEILQAYILKLDLYGNYVIDYKRMLYDQESYVNGNWSGYLKMDAVGENYDKFLVYYPQSFMQPNYIYSIRIQLSDGSFLKDMEQFMIIDTSSESSSGVIISSGDSDTIITDQENNQGDITGSINDLNTTVGNLGNTINDAILGEENESGDRVGGLLGGILDGIKSFFIPEDDYFSNYFTELNDWFSARLGLLYFPFDLLFDFFDRVTSIDFNNQVLSIGPYTLPLNDDFELVPKIEFDFKTFIENEDIKGVYDTYLIIIDGLIIFGLSQLIRIKYEEVFGK